MLALKWIVFGVGVASLSTTFFVGITFLRSRWPLGNALAADKLVESIAGIVTMIFASNAIATGSNDIDMIIASGMRLAIFGPAMLVAWHLYYKTKAFNDVRDAAELGDRVAAEYADLSPAQLMAVIERHLEQMKKGSG